MPDVIDTDPDRADPNATVIVVHAKPVDPPYTAAGPAAWWNPLSSAFAPNAFVFQPIADGLLRKRAEWQAQAAARVVHDAKAVWAARNGVEKVVVDAAGEALWDRLGDPPTIVAGYIGEPTWGYRPAKATAVALGIVALGVGGALAYRHLKRKH